MVTFSHRHRWAPTFLPRASIFSPCATQSFPLPLLSPLCSTRSISCFVAMPTTVRCHIFIEILCRIDERWATGVENRWEAFVAPPIAPRAASKEDQWDHGVFRGSNVLGDGPIDSAYGRWQTTLATIVSWIVGTLAVPWLGCTTAGKQNVTTLPGKHRCRQGNKRE
jgi:hypothetical protein